MRRSQTKRALRFRIRIFCSKHRTSMIAVRIALFICISMAVGILTVCFTASKKPDQTCALTLKSINRNSINDNSHPKSIAVHDFNNDSKLDIAVANSGTNNIGIFLGKGDATFSRQIIYPTGTDSRPSSVAVGDFNNDHQLDIVVANYGSNNIGILFGNGDGTFTRQISFSTGSSRPLWVAVGDFNNDSRLDIVIVSYGTNSLGVVFGYGNGNFTSQRILSTAYDSLPFSAVVGDFNNDQKQDIAVSNSGTHNIVIFLGDGNGTFPIQTTSSTGIGSQPHVIAIADLNHDTKLDIAVTSYGADNVCVFFGYGNGSFVMQETYSTGIHSKPVSVVIGDFNNDNHLDIVVANTGTNNVVIFLGYSNGTFANHQSFSTGSSSSPYFAVSGDFNSDSRLDIAVANYDANNVDILLSYPNITLSGQKTYTTDLNSKPSSVVVGDFNNDSLLDIVVANIGNSNIGVFIGNGDGTFSSQKTYSIGDESYQLVIGVGDFNNDRLLDIVVAGVTGNGSYVGIFLGNSNGTLSNLMTQSANINSDPIWIDVGDFNNDNQLDIVLGDDRTLEVLLGNGDGTFADEVSFASDSNFRPQSVAVADFNNDSRLDIVVANKLDGNSLSSSVGIRFGHGNGTFSEEKTFSTGYYALTQSVAVGDINNDSRPDIVVANPWNTNVGVLLGYGNGTFSGQKTESTGIDSNPTFVAVYDFNNDRRLDILVVKKGINTVTIFLGYGDGTFTDQLNYPTGNGSDVLWVAFGDFNNDTLIDIVIAHSANNNIGIMLGSANVNFANKATFSTGSSPGPRFVAVNDFDKDKRLDIAVANYITDNVDVFLGNEQGRFSMQMTYSSGSFSSPTSIAIDDFNNDSQLDIAVANSGNDNIGIFFGYGNGTFGGQTTYAVVDGSNPQSIAHGDFNNDYRPDIIVANYATDNINILLNSDGGRFSTGIPYSTGYGSDPHAIATGDINNDRILDIVVANNNNGNGNIGVFFGNGNGTFSNQKTYSVGNNSYLVLVAVGDFNNDSRLDIVAVDNAGYKILILLQDENGDFSNHESYYTNYDSWPTAVVVEDLNNDSRLDIIVGMYKTNNVYIFIGNGNGTFAYLHIYRTGDGAGLRSIAVGDFNNDGRPDLTIANTWNNNVGILLGNGDGTFSDQKTYPTNTRSLPLSIAVGDFDQDNQLDIVVANQGADNVGVLFGYGNGTFSDQVTFSTGAGSQPLSIAVGDFNNDGRLDIAVANSQTGNVGILLGYVNRTFFSQITLLTDDHFSLPYSVVVGYFNHDTLLDIAVCNQYSETIDVFLALPEDTFLNVPPYPTGPASQPKYVAVADFNNDRRLDAAIANFGTNNIMILFGSGYGTISSEMTYSTGYNSQPCWLAIGDLNNDNRLDIVVANSGNDSVGVLFGYGNGTFSNQIAYSTGVKSQPSSVIIGDFNNDTRLDIAVANYGSNNVGLLFGYGNGSFASQTQFSAGYDSRPIALTSGDVNNDNVSDVIITNNGYGDIEILLELC